ncbi:alpha/beta hydrolase fold protein [Caballeronia catudaia]|uniref:Alpha/beta hydrolase fold protein n=1 Tax=Caballeronia catudaia TaxID=1777136 RepID=A0A158AGI5_9BURK|nr:alpha/beta hydrolase [Caballeronia catudaia]SAK56860.1 alpha/beta hydrolase fold protein [Caballeronia catudaia]
MRSSPNETKSSRSPLIGGVALASLGIAAWTAVRARRAERDYPPTGQFIEVDGVRLHYFDKGEGPVVVLLHGNLVTAQDFLACGLFDRLAQRHRVIAFDRPGFGFSTRPRDRVWTPQAQAELFQRALKKMGLARAVIVGQSLGCLVALAMALDARIDIRGLTLIAGYYYPNARADVAISAPAAIPLIGDVMRYTVSPVVARLMYDTTVRAMFAPRETPAQFHASVPREIVLRPSQMRATAQDAAFMIPAAAAMSGQYHKIAVPVRIFGGSDDAIVDTTSQSGRLSGDIGQSVLSVTPGLGHMLHYDDAGRIGDAVETMAIE